MRIVAWNCKGAFHRKHSIIASQHPDVLVVPECAKLDTLTNVNGAAPVRSFEWIGDVASKGLGVISYGNYELNVHEAYDERHRWILPLHVTGPTSYTLFAVWAMPHVESHYYVQSLLEALDAYAPLLEATNVVWAGDFNNNVSLDIPKIPLKFSGFLDRMAEHRLHSLYHLSRKCEHGAEPDPTFFMYHHASRGFHIDFVFASPALTNRGFDLTVGDHANWAKASDHMPLTCTFRD